MTSNVVFTTSERSQNDATEEADSTMNGHYDPPKEQPDEAEKSDPELERDVEKQQIPDSDNNEKEKSDPNLVDWDGPDDPENPMNWSRSRKWIITLAMGLLTLTITFASSVFSTANLVTSEEFGVSEVVMVLGTSLFVLGFAIGPPIWGPLSELYGRKYPLFFGFFVMAIFQIPVAVAQNLYTIMITRFFGGMFGCAPLAIVGGALADFWDPVERGVALVVFSGATFVGPVFGPIIGGFIVQSYLGWRWTEYLTAIMAFSFGTIAWFIIPETLGSVILQRRAKRLRYETKNWALHAKADEDRVDMKIITTKFLLRPFKMLIMEPILVLVTIYLSLVYGILYLFFESFPIAFQQQRGWNLGVGALPFISIIIGVSIGAGIIIVFTKTRFKREFEKNGQVVPEERLIPMMIGGALLPIGLFWFAWTSSPNIIWVPQVMAAAPAGAGILMIFMQGLNYIIDVYKMNANSAIAGNTFIRSMAGAGFPMFAIPMYRNLGVPWATSLLGFLTVALFPVPILFYKYGAKIREWSRYPM